ncbi:MAG: hypothetical protein ABF370_19115 [Verrucomicrobiales bacterium]
MGRFASADAWEVNPKANEHTIDKGLPKLDTRPLLSATCKHTQSLRAIGGASSNN